MSDDTYEPLTIELANGTKLDVRIDVPVMRRLRRHDPPLDIRRVIDPDDPNGGLYGMLNDDISLAVDIAHEATRHNPNWVEDPTEFADGLAGDALDEILKAVIEGICRFTRNRTARKALLTLIQKTEAAADKVMQEALEEIESDKMDQTIEQAVREVASDSTPSKLIDESSSSAESSGSTQEGRTP